MIQDCRPRRGLIVLASVVLGGCQALNASRLDVSEFDLGPLPTAVQGNPVLQLRGVEVAAPSWLASQTMQYRLLYDQPAQRRSYSDSRWVAPPAELLETALRRAIVSSETIASGTGCKLRVDLDELIQAFQSATESRAIMEVRVALLAPRSDRVLARKRFSVTQVATSADARGGVAATAAAVQSLSAELRDWLGRLDGNLAPRCAGN